MLKVVAVPDVVDKLLSVPPVIFILPTEIVDVIADAGVRFSVPALTFKVVASDIDA
jgi:hypothetical protein